jgi:methylenetetrahydrofolate dehydrogenase (NADP+)/methenyltetrahydrofolate cyclohydrolase
MIVHGRVIAKEILAACKREVESLGLTPVIRAVTVSPTPATISYLNIKTKQAAEAGMELVVFELEDSATTANCIEAVLTEGADAVIVQLPLPSHIDTQKVLDSIPLEQDADVLSDAARALFEVSTYGAPLPPVVAAIAEILAREEISLEEKHVVIMGNGFLVGGPASIWCENQGANVSVITLEYPEYELLEDADVIISGAGTPHFIQPDMIKDGVILIDAGTSESEGIMVGDIDPACVEKASLYTPVPGGVGPIAVACLFRNVLLK